ncbi:hypothetical protein AFA91_33185 [Mycolicibacterium goodii]|uniref:Uncharacterized protein n=1 Tax=Mycolicibacterium goodii TaxID=134601 RepID=A0A0K0XEX6_MYCGD|nr:hypothetical protein AFA91_33185 [Mycolicibacterium goodii]
MSRSSGGPHPEDLGLGGLLVGEHPIIDECGCYAAGPGQPGDAPPVFRFGADDHEFAAERADGLHAHAGQDPVELHVVLDSAVRADRASRPFRAQHRETGHTVEVLDTGRDLADHPLLGGIVLWNRDHLLTLWTSHRRHHRANDGYCVENPW